MRKACFIMALMLVVLLAGISLAVDINISDEQGNLISTYTVSDTGSIDITVSTGTTTPPPPPPSPGAPTLSVSPNTLPGGTAGSSYSVNVSMSASNGTAPYTYSCYGTGLAGITTGNTVINNTCVISGTPASSGPYSVTFRVDDDAGQSAQTTRSFTVDPSTPPPPGGSEPPDVKLLTNGKSVRFVEIKAGETHYYKFTISQSMSGGWHGMVVSMGTNDWQTNQDMMFSLGLPYPTNRDYTVGQSVALNGDVVNGSRKWGSISKGSSNESVQISSGLAAGTYYIMVYNTAGIDGHYELYYSAW